MTVVLVLVFLPSSFEVAGACGLGGLFQWVQWRISVPSGRVRSAGHHELQGDHVFRWRRNDGNQVG